jgi:recombination protein RecA
MEETEKKDEKDVIRENEKFTNSLIKSLNKSEKVAYSLEADDNPTDVKEFISTGSTILDYLISNKRNGGVPVGKISEFSGETGSGKSLIMSHIIANTQKKGGIAALIDTENAANPDFMKRVGVDLKRLVYMQPETIESCFENIEQIIIKTREKYPNKERPVTIIWDSIAATPPAAEIEGDFDPNSRIGVAAKAMSKGMRKITQTVGKEYVTMVFTNQIRDKIGVMFGDPHTTPYGHAVPFHASVRVRLTIKHSNDVKDAANNNEVLGIGAKAKVIKTRFGPPYRACDFNIMFDHGIEDEKSWFHVLHEKGVIRKEGGWCYITLDNKPYKFREVGWNQFLGKENARDKVLDVLDGVLVKKFDVNDLMIDPESYMEVSQLQSELIE